MEDKLVKAVVGVLEKKAAVAGGLNVSEDLADIPHSTDEKYQLKRLQDALKMKSAETPMNKNIMLYRALALGLLGAGGGALVGKGLGRLAGAGIGAGVGGGVGALSGKAALVGHESDVGAAKELLGYKDKQRILNLFKKNLADNKRVAEPLQAVRSDMEEAEMGREYSKEAAERPDLKEAVKKELTMHLLYKAASWEGFGAVSTDDIGAVKPQGGAPANVEELRTANIQKKVIDLYKMPTKPDGGAPAEPNIV